MKRSLHFLAGILLAATTAACADTTARADAAIASAHPLATAAGHEILDAGGNAFDAAVAVAAALSVVEPYSSGLGGGGFYLLHRVSDGHEVFVDARETAPLAATVDMFLDEHGEPVMERMREGALSAGIPGIPAAMIHFAEKYGQLPLARSLAPAIRLARDGFDVDIRFVTLTERAEDKLRRHSTAAYFIDGRVPREGERLRQPELAATLERFAEDSGESFYRGAIAEKLVAGVRAAGGIWTAEDLAQYRVVEREPLIGTYRGYRIVTAPPPSSGIVLLATLNILAGFDLAEFDEVTRTHLLVEAWRRAYRDRGQYLGDPDFVDIPVSQLLDENYAAGLRAGIRFDRATPSRMLPPVAIAEESAGTTHFSIVDADGNRVAGTQTVNFRYGSGVMPAGTGVVLNNEMFDFAARPGTPDGFQLVTDEANLVAPGKRPVSSMTAAFIEGPRGVAVFGTPGGSRIVTMVTLALLDYIDGRPMDEIVARPRFHHQFLPDAITFEPGAFDEAMRERLQGMGHELRESPRRYGNMNVVTVDRGTGEAVATTDPRNEAVVDF